MFSFIIPITILSAIFSIVLFTLSSKIIDDYVITQFESQLELVSNEVIKNLDVELVTASESNDIDAYNELHTTLNNAKNEYGVKFVYVISKAGGYEHTVASSEPDARNDAYPFIDQMHQAIDNSSTEISDIYKDQYGVQKSIFVPLPGTDTLLGIDMDAKFIDTINTIVIFITIITTIGSIIFGATVSYFFSRGILKPINLGVEVVREISKGNLNVEKFPLHNKDEISVLSNGIFTMMDDLRAVIGDVKTNLEQVSSTSVQLAASMQQNSSSIEEVTSSIQEVAENSGIQKQSIEEVTASVTQISMQVTDIASRSDSMALKSNNTTEIALKSNSAIQNAVVKMNETSSVIVKTSDVINQLNQYTIEIGEIINIITTITAQTNLLALNASIEAARAGEHGKGFAVVAEEVRKLADQSQMAANDITQRVENIRTESNLAVKFISLSATNIAESTNEFKNAGQSFDTISNSLSSLSGEVLDVQNSVMSLKNYVNEIIIAVQVVNESIAVNTENTITVAATSEEQSVSIEEIASAATNLAEMSEELNEKLMKFKV